MDSLGTLNSDQRVGCAASPLPSGVQVAPVGPVARDREAVLRKAVCGHGELPAGRVILWCAAGSGAAGSPVRASPGGPAVPLPSGVAGGCAWVSESCTGHAGWCKDPREAIQSLLQSPVS